jgi:hypothetical protein
MLSRKNLWTLLIGGSGFGAALLSGMLITSPACSCEPAENVFVYMLDYYKMKLPMKGLNRDAVIGRVPLGTPIDEFQEIVSRLTKNAWAKCSRLNESEIQCIVRTEVSWFSAIQSYKRVQFQFDADRKFSDVRIDAYTCRFSTLVEPANDLLKPTPECGAS